MFNIFGIKVWRKTKEDARLEDIAKKKKAYQERKTKITAFLNDYHEKEFQKRKERYQLREELAEKHNSECPKCKSTNVVNHIKRTKGEIHGNSHSNSYISSSNFFLGSSSYSSSNRIGKIDGQLDTYPVNKCNDCGHEWKIEEAEWPEVYDKFSAYSSNPRFFFNLIYDYLKLEYDPEDITEECNSLEEKQQKYIDRNKGNTFFKLYRTLPKYMLDYVLYQGIKCERFIDIEELRKNGFWGISDKTDDYSYEMPQELWEVCQKIIGWKGEDES